MERALGVLWNTETDLLGFKIQPKDKPNTKRGLMSVISSVYDPLGFVSPVILQAKKIFQDECKARKGWDDPLSPSNLNKWCSWTDNLNKLENYNIPRCLIPVGFGEITQCQLHHFSDGSIDGFGSVSYIRVENSVGQVHCAFLMSKSRLAPIKQLTIPRLELSAAVTSVRLDCMLRRELRIKIDESVFWSDSTVILQYISSENKRFHTFVANRIAIIHDGSDKDQWRHVDSKNNPADDVSRGLTVGDMIISQRWKNGPTFLWKDESQWPTMPNLKSENQTDDKEVKREIRVYSTVMDSKFEVINKLFGRYSSWYKLKRGVAWILRLCQLLRDKARDGSKTAAGKGSLKVSELKSAERAIVQALQRQNFAEELRCLHEGRSIKKTSSVYRLDPVLDSGGLLCVGGRLGSAPISSERKHPMILPREHHVVTLIVRQCHETNGHSGREHVLSLLRERFWILKGRRIVKRILFNCIHCKRHQKRPESQRMADLPLDRVTPGESAFTNIGLDCFGPYMVKWGRCQEKRYGCIFTCLATRAIHIEKLNSMDADSFLNGFIRFESWRG